jgi:four helix bundle protein
VGVEISTLWEAIPSWNGAEKVGNRIAVKRDVGRATGDVFYRPTTHALRPAKRDDSIVMDRIKNNEAHELALVLFDKFWKDSEIIGQDYRGREIVRQLVRSIGSISANIEEGYGRGYGKPYAQFLRIARGSARESKGWYIKARQLIPLDVLNKRCEEIDIIIGKLVRAINEIGRKL